MLSVNTRLQSLNITLCDIFIDNDGCLSFFYRVLFHYFEKFLLEYETRFEREYGYFRPVMQEVVERYLDCGNPMCGFARIRCLEIKGNCERFVASIKNKFLL